MLERTALEIYLSEENLKDTKSKKKNQESKTV